MMTKTTANLSPVEVAHYLHERGFHVFPTDHPDQPKCIGLHGPASPCDGQRGKHPAVKFGTWAVTVTPQLIDLAWQQRRGLANIGVACGPTNLVVFDEDKAGELDRWCVTYGVTLPDTYTVATGRGRHLYFSWNHIKQRIGNVPKAVKDFDMDVRGDGGMVIGEGSQHVSGAIYTGNTLPIAALPPQVAEILLAAQTDRDESATESPWETFTGGDGGADPNTTKIGFHHRHHDLIAYAGRLRNIGLDYHEATPVYRQRWLLCEQPTETIPEAQFHSPDCPYQVTWDEAKAKLRDVYERYAAGQPEADNAESYDSAEESEVTTWEAFDLGPWLGGERKSPQPAVGISRSDGQKVIYPGREHTIFGETESGKSWFALESAAVEIRMGRDVLYIHYEEGDPGSTIERLQLLAVTPAEITKHLRFVAPARPAREDWLHALLDPPPALVVHDGVNEAMSLHADKIMDVDGSATFRRRLIKPCLRVGAATLSCDHVTKNSDTRGRYAIGSVHKINAIDGAAFLVENVEPFGRGLRGVSYVYVAKDRPGQLRARGKPTKLPGKTFIGTLVVDAEPMAGPDFLTFYAPKQDDPASDGSGGSGERLADIVADLITGMPDGKVDSFRLLLAELRKAGHQFRDVAVRDAIDDLIVAGRLQEFQGKRGARGLGTVSTASEKVSE